MWFTAPLRGTVHVFDPSFCSCSAVLGMFAALKRETTGHMLAMCLKTMTTLIFNTPYFKLTIGKDLLEFFCSPVFMGLLVHKDRSVRANSIGALATSFATPKKIPGMDEYLAGSGEEVSPPPNALMQTLLRDANTREKASST